MNHFKTTALILSGGCLSLCLAASPAQSLQLHFQSPDGLTRANIDVGSVPGYYHGVEIDFHQDQTKDPIESFLKGESYRVHYHNGTLDPYLRDLLRNNPVKECDFQKCLFPLGYMPGSLYSNSALGFVANQYSNQWHFHNLMGAPWRTNPSAPYPAFSRGLFDLKLNCGYDLSSCVGSSGTMRLYTTSSHSLLYEGQMRLTGFTSPTPPPPPPPPPAPIPQPDPTTVPEPSVILGLLLLGSLGVLKSQRN
ncbi:PEP-CTERM sorting domain-containing protein [Roseofilum casamattae]|uniref:PEP-CTERM sorting domain-containing protein n=1 Tax=Roseofilum casamattae BLCC-M143 TaxID=3022442 RepID=A0ABT7C4B7_9CYAN|nr:PEP-CTERM sorting domain-containing protein [Roseofilum casamattae]MDJ1185691.1 PEP-CTERM sorting domain-containing protein [Roseofilum casamattae BLCC-M143]